MEKKFILKLTVFLFLNKVWNASILNNYLYTKCELFHKLKMYYINAYVFMLRIKLHTSISESTKLLKEHNNRDMKHA